MGGFGQGTLYPAVAPTADQFLADYPEFNTGPATDPSAVNFSTSAIGYWLSQSVNFLNAGVWGNQYYMAVELFMAHNLALEAWAAQGGPQTVPGLAKGMIAGTASGDVSVSYNSAAVFELGAGHWNFTIYGLRLKRMIETIAPAGLYIGAGMCGSQGYSAWAGPWVFNVPNFQQ